MAATAGFDTELIALAYADRGAFGNGIPPGTPTPTAKVIKSLIAGPAGADAMVRGGLPVDQIAKVMAAVQRGPKARLAAAREPEAFELKSNSYATAAHVMRDASLRAALLGEGLLEHNEMTLEPTVGRRPVTSEMLSALREQLERIHSVKLARADIEAALLQVAHERPFHPVRDYLMSLSWDGRPRLDDMAAVIGADPTPLNRAMLRKWFVSAVARAMKPGAKVDTVLILVGPQGAGKSTFFFVLGGPYYTDTAITPGDKDSLLALHSAWIFEWAELESYQRARSANSVKAFISSREDLFRPPYARATGRFPRSCVIVGTTNDEQFLSDPTGGRRYWTIKVASAIDLQAVKENRDQIWAEAVQAFMTGEPWHLTPEQDLALREVQRDHEVEDAWEEEALAFAAQQPEGVTTTEVLIHLGKPLAAHARADSMRAAAILTKAGYERRRATRPDGRPWVYVRPSHVGGET